MALPRSDRTKNLTAIALGLLALAVLAEAALAKEDWELSPEERAVKYAKILAEGDEEERVRAVEMLREPEAADIAVPALARALSDNSELVRSAAARMLGTFGAAAAPALPALEEALLEPICARDVAGGLGLLAKELPQAVTILLKGLRSDDLKVQLGAVKGLTFAGPAAAPAVPALREILIGTSRTILRVFAVHVLGTIGPAAADAAPDLLHALDSEDLRAEAAWSLGYVGADTEGAVKKLRTLLSAEKPEVRRGAAFALFALAGDVEESLPILTEAVKGDGGFREIDALGRMGAAAASAVPAIAARLEDLDEFVRGAAAEALGRIGVAEGAVAPLVDRLEAKESRVEREKIVTALGRIGAAASPAVVPLLRLLAEKDSRPALRREVARTLGAIGPAARAAVPVLRKTLEKWSFDEELCRVVEEALGKIEVEEDEGK